MNRNTQTPAANSPKHQQPQLLANLLKLQDKNEDSNTIRRINKLQFWAYSSSNATQDLFHHLIHSKHLILLKIRSFLIFQTTHTTASQAPCLSFLVLTSLNQQITWINKVVGVIKLKFNHLITSVHTFKITRQWSSPLQNTRLFVFSTPNKCLFERFTLVGIQSPRESQHFWWCLTLAQLLKTTSSSADKISSKILKFCFDSPIDDDDYKIHIDLIKK